MSYISLFFAPGLFFFGGAGFYAYTFITLGILAGSLLLLAGNVTKNRKTGSYDLIYTATDNSGNTSSDLRYILVSDQDDCYSSVKDADNSNIILYPNFGDGKFSLIFNTKTELNTRITIYNALGNVVSESDELIKPNQVKTFNYQTMKPGMYFIKLNQGENIITLKYVLVK